MARSPHVALGYHGRAELTAERFGTLRGERTYRTGDLARRAPDGTLTVPRPRRPAGQDPRVPGGAGRDRDLPGGPARRGAGRGGGAPRGAAARARRSWSATSFRPLWTVRATPGGAGRGAARLHGAARDRAARRAAADRHREARRARAARSATRRRPRVRGAGRGRRGDRAGLVRGAGPARGRAGRQLLRPRRALPADGARARGARGRARQADPDGRAVRPPDGRRARRVPVRRGRPTRRRGLPRPPSGRRGAGRHGRGGRDGDRRAGRSPGRRSDDDAIAVVGMACRVPGAPDVATFWRNLLDGVDSVRRESRVDTAGRTTWPAYGYLDGLDGFDADHFGYTDDEAARLDPQHRLFLEVAATALADAGEQAGTVGCLRGCRGQPVLPVPRAAPAAPRRSGRTRSPAAHRTTCPPGWPTSWGSPGPRWRCRPRARRRSWRCARPRRACSTSAATWRSPAARRSSPRRRPATGTGPTARCPPTACAAPFDAAADGMVFGNGAGAVVLKRLADALDDGDHVDAVLRRLGGQQRRRPPRRVHRARPRRPGRGRGRGAGRGRRRGRRRSAWSRRTAAARSSATRSSSPRSPARSARAPPASARSAR